MCGHGIQQSTNQLRKVANPVYGQLNREKFPCRRSRRRIWFRETGLAVPSLVSLLILYTNAESGAYSRYSSRIPRRRPYIFTSTTHHRVSPEFIGSRNCVPIAFTAESPCSPQGSSSNGCCLCITMDQMLLCSSLFPHPLLIYSENVRIIGCIQVYKYQNISTTAVFCCGTVCGTVFCFFPPTYRVQCTRYNIVICCISKHSYYCCTDCGPVSRLPTSVCTCV